MRIRKMAAEDLSDPRLDYAYSVDYSGEFLVACVREGGVERLESGVE